MIRATHTTGALHPRQIQRLFSAMAAALALGAALAAPAPAATQEDHTQFSVIAGSLSFSTAPGLPVLSAVTLDGQAQTTNTAMTNFGVADATGSGSGWNVTVEGQSSTGKSAVFAQYCPKTKCGTEAEGYVAGGRTLPPDSLTLNSTSASFSAQGTTTGASPTLECAAGCDVDNAGAVKIASAATGAGMGTWQTTGFTGTSLALSTPSTLEVLPSEEIYRVNLLWTLSTGP